MSSKIPQKINCNEIIFRKIHAQLFAKNIDIFLFNLLRNQDFLAKESIITSHKNFQEAICA